MKTMNGPWRMWLPDDETNDEFVSFWDRLPSSVGGAVDVEWYASVDAEYAADAELAHSACAQGDCLCGGDDYFKPFVASLGIDQEPLLRGQHGNGLGAFVKRERIEMLKRGKAIDWNLRDHHQLPLWRLEQLGHDQDAIVRQRGMRKVGK